MAKWMLGAAVVAGGLGLAATPAKAAEFGVYIGTPVAYVPPCPGPGYEWVAGYYSGGYWIPGRWAFVGVRERGYGYGYPLVRYYDRDDYRHRDWDRDRHDWDDHRWRDRDEHRWHDRDDRGWRDRDHDRR